MRVIAELDLSELNAAVRAAIAGAVMATAGQGKEAWQEAVLRAPGVWSKEKDNYHDSIQMRQTGDFSAEIFTDYSVAKDIEEGRPHKNLKRYLAFSTKTRRVKKGRHAGQKYLIIPFRHNTPGNTAHAKAMPPNIHQMASGLLKSRVIGEGARLSATGHLVSQKQYAWAKSDKLPKGAMGPRRLGRLPEGLTGKLKPHHATDIYAGMVRFDTSSGKQKSSQYLTFRIMGEWQDGKWIVPAKPGLFIAKGVAEALGPELKKALGEALG